MRNTRYVMLVLYDLPVKEPNERREYRRFRKFLLRNGYIAVQKSIYAKLLINSSRLTAETAMISGAVPKDGCVNLLPMSITEFRNLSAVVGENFNMSIFEDDLVVI